MLYESFKLLWSFWHYKENCEDFAFLSLGFMVLNVIWGITSYLGFKAIKSKNSRNIKLFGYTVFANFLLRIIMYIICGIVMSGYSTKYIEITVEEYDGKYFCKYRYHLQCHLPPGSVHNFRSHRSFTLHFSNVPDEEHLSLCSKVGKQWDIEAYPIKVSWLI